MSRFQSEYLLHLKCRDIDYTRTIVGYPTSFEILVAIKDLLKARNQYDLDILLDGIETLILLYDEYLRGVVKTVKHKECTATIRLVLRGDITMKYLVKEARAGIAIPMPPSFLAEKLSEEEAYQVGTEFVEVVQQWCR